MILGISTHAFTLLHVTLSLIGIASGMIVAFGLLADQLKRRWISLFLFTTVLTSITGFAFPNSHITPGIVLGILSLIALSIAVFAIHARHLAGCWRATFVVSATLALYFNVFVLIAQLFRHVPMLSALDPAGSGPGFGITELVVLTAFTWLTFAALKKFKNGPDTITPRSVADFVTVKRGE